MAGRVWMAGSATGMMRLPLDLRGVTSLMLLLMLLLVVSVSAAPYTQKRTSDQTLAQRETEMRLKNINGIMMTVPVAFGVVDPKKLGRRRRSDKRAISSTEDFESVEGNYEDRPRNEKVEVNDLTEADGRLSELIAALKFEPLV